MPWCEVGSCGRQCLGSAAREHLQMGRYAVKRQLAVQQAWRRSAQLSHDCVCSSPCASHAGGLGSDCCCPQSQGTALYVKGSSPVDCEIVRTLLPHQQTDRQVSLQATGQNPSPSRFALITLRQIDRGHRRPQGRTPHLHALHSSLAPTGRPTASGLRRQRRQNCQSCWNGWPLSSPPQLFVQNGLSRSFLTGLPPCWLS